MTTTFTNLRTISLALVIGAMLMAGIMMPVHQATAQQVSTTSSELVAVELERQKLLLELIHTLQETILRYERQLTVERGQTPGENLINQNSVAYTQKQVRLYENPDYSDEYVSQNKEELGEVVQGPKLVDKEVWWEFEFRDGKRGWSPEQYFTREPSVVLRIDTDQDGMHDVKMRFIGEYDTDGFYVEPAEDGTYIKYRGDSVEPFSVKQL